MYKGVNEFKKVYYPRFYVIKKYDGTVVADATSILSSRPTIQFRSRVCYQESTRNYLGTRYEGTHQVLAYVNDVRAIEINSIKCF